MYNVTMLIIPVWLLISLGVLAVILMGSLLAFAFFAPSCHIKRTPKHRPIDTIRKWNNAYVTEIP